MNIDKMVKKEKKEMEKKEVGNKKGKKRRK